MKYNIAKGVFLRFLRGAFAGALSTMVVVVGSVSYKEGITTFADVEQLGYALIIALIIGGISGGIQALDKYYRSTSDTSPRAL